MTSAAKTRDRIVQASLELFNLQGERNVTTNHIAAHLGISPGNLYYHFPNKQAIIAELFSQYAASVDAVLQRPADRALTVEDKAAYLEALLAVIWRYRFLHRDLQHQLQTSPELREQYRQFARRALVQAQAVYRGFVEAGILRMSEQQIEAIVINAWIVLTTWVHFLETVGGSQGDPSEEQMRRGVYQVLTLEGGYLAEDSRAAVEALYDKLHVPLARVIPDVAAD